MFPSDLRHFKHSEFSMPDALDVPLLRWLDRVRQRSGVRMVVTSDYRLGDAGLHGRGRAVDIRIRDLSANEKFRLARAVFDLADEAPAPVEFVVGYNREPHFHLGVDYRAGAVHEYVEAKA